jgi:hypothetical protein
MVADECREKEDEVALININETRKTRHNTRQLIGAHFKA